MTLPLLILISVFLTSTLSGVLGMAGGMILMAILVSALSVSASMMIHGVVQATANGSRAYFLRKHIQFSILPAYLLGAAVAFGLFALLSIVANAAIILIMIGIFPWLARLLPFSRGLDVTRSVTATSCGLLVTSAQLFAGASGPLLDVFYLNSSLSRYQIIATKAFTQALGHLIKLLYYGVVIGVTDMLPGWLILAAILTSIAGTRLGTHLLKFLSEHHFRRVSAGVILTIGFLLVLKGVFELI